VIYGVSSPKVNIDKKGNKRKIFPASALEAVLKLNRISRQEELRALKTDARTTNHGRKPRKTRIVIAPKIGESIFTRENAR
jgi:hypothetical protein